MIGRNLRYFATCVSFYAISYFALWTVYSMTAQIGGGVYTVIEAHSLVLRMASITTVLCVVAVTAGKLIFRSGSVLRKTLQSGLCTGLILIAYTALNVIWRASWNPSSGKPAFLPAWGDVNGHFFHEYNWLSYLLLLTPLAMVAASVLIWLAEYRKA